MNKVLIIIITLFILATLAFLSYKALYKPTISPIIPTVSEDLQKELMLTEDDGGQADLKALDQDASGL